MDMCVWKLIFKLTCYKQKKDDSEQEAFKTHDKQKVTDKSTSNVSPKDVNYAQSPEINLTHVTIRNSTAKKRKKFLSEDEEIEMFDGMNLCTL